MHDVFSKAKFHIKIILIFTAKMVLFVAGSVSIAFSQQSFKFPESIVYDIYNDNTITMEKSEFRFIKQGRYKNTSLSIFRFPNQDIQLSKEIYSYIHSLNYSVVSSLYFQGNTKIIEVKYKQSKSLDNKDSMVVEFKRANFQGFDSLTKPYLLIDLNAAMLLTAYQAYGGLNTREIYYLSISMKPEQIKQASMKMAGMDKLVWHNKMKKVNVYQIQDINNDVNIKFYIHRDDAGYYYPIKVMFVKLNVHFIANKVMH